jgi:hypothetical protein
MFHLEFRNNQHPPEHARQMYNDAQKTKGDQGNILLQDTKKGTQGNMTKKEPNKETNCPLNKELDVDYVPFIYTSKGSKLTFRRMSYDYRMMCPNFYNETRYIVQHMSKSKCQKNEDIN